MTIVHRLEDSGFNIPRGNYIIVSFETEYRGIWQCKWTEVGLEELDVEPSIETLKTKHEQAIREIGPIMFYFTHGLWPEDLSMYDT